MVHSQATPENEGLRWFRQALAAEKILDALRARTPENVSELRPRPRRARVQASELSPARVRGAC